MAKLWRRPRDGEDKSLHVHEVDLKNLRVTKPTVIFLNGFFTTDDKPTWAAASIRNIEELLKTAPGPRKDFDVYAWTHEGLKDFFNVTAYGLAPQRRACRAARTLAAGLIMPLVSDNFALDAKGKATGTPLPLEEAKKNLRNITFFGYSAGGVTAQECFNASLQMMRQIGYDEKDARAVLREAVSISVGTMSRPSKEGNRFTSLAFEATNDRIVRMRQRIIAPLRNIFNRFAPDLRLKPVSDSSAVVTAAVSKKNWEKRERGGKTGKQKIDLLLPAWIPFGTFHELPRYVTEDEELSPFAKMVRYGLTNAVDRTGTADPLKLLDPPPGTENRTATAYKDKLSKAKIVKPKK
jgi:hypothetical protein